MAVLFTPLQLRELTFRNRIFVSPMCQYSCSEGLATDWHLVHLGSRAVGGAALVIAEAAAVVPEGRISPHDLGIWSEQHAEALRPVASFVRAQGAVAGIQLAHAGRKASTHRPWEGSGPVSPEHGGWQPVAPSAAPFQADWLTPRALTEAELAQLPELFAEAAARALRVGFQVIELHAAHGYLLSSFITPLQNTRTDEYGGSLENRLRYPLEVFAAMREAWPSDKPMSIRISATDWAGENGITPDDAVEIGEAFAREGADLIDVSAGQTWANQQPVYGRMFQTPFSDKIRNEGKLATMAVGNIYEPDHANSILAAGRADLVALARPHLVDPFWTLRAAAALDYRDVYCPPQYLNGLAQLARNLQREAEAAAALRV
jgi:anthraniloyl-CoA monooxygenase